MRQRAVAWLVLVAACATAPTGTPLGPTPQVSNAINVSSANIDTVLYLGVQLPVAGSQVGGDYNGLLKVYQGPIYGTPQLEAAWESWMMTSGVEMLRAAGYKIKQASGIFAGVQNFSGVSYAIAGKATSFQLNHYGSLAGNKTVVSLSLTWEVLKATTRDVVYSRTLSGNAETAGASGASVRLAFRQSFAEVLADPLFVQSLTTPKPAEVAAASSGAAANWRRPQPTATDIVALKPSDYNPSHVGTVFQRVAQSVVTLHGDQGQGSAFIITRDGLAITNHHVIEGQSRLSARFSTGIERPVRVLRSDAEADVALVQVACDTDCTTVELESGRDVPVGTEIYTIGAPLGLSQTLTRGVISGVRLSHGLTLLQTDAAVNAGNSGGPMVEVTTGKVVAIVSSKLVGQGVEGIAFGIAITDAMRVLGIRQ